MLNDCEAENRFPTDKIGLSTNGRLREKPNPLTKEQLTDMLIQEYKLKRVLAKMLDAELNKIQRIEKIIGEPNRLLNMPGAPTAGDLRRMLGDE
jgi:hypothetical protein